MFVGCVTSTALPQDWYSYSALPASDNKAELRDTIVYQRRYDKHEQ